MPRISRSRRSTCPPTPTSSSLRPSRPAFTASPRPTPLPDPVNVDPATLSSAELESLGVVPLPHTLAEVTDAFEADDVLAEALGTELATTIVDLRRAEVERFADASPDDLAAAARWKY